MVVKSLKASYKKKWLRIKNKWARWSTLLLSGKSQAYSNESDDIFDNICSNRLSQWSKAKAFVQLFK